MKLTQLSLEQSFNNSFLTRQDSYPRNHNNWHYHEELELIFIYEGNGTLFIGDRIENFSAGDVVLIGPNLPHYWLFDNLIDAQKEEPIDCIVIHFKKDFAGPSFLNLPELSQLKTLISDAEKGLMIKKTTPNTLGQLIQSVNNTAGVLKFSLFLQCLSAFADSSYNKLVSANYSILNHSNDQLRMNDVMNYIRENYRGKIELEKLASHAKMTKNSFCRYFKFKTGKTPLQFVSEIKIAHACRLLKETDLNLKEICFDSGFNNFVSFHKIFKSQIGLTPSQFRKA